MEYISNAFDEIIREWNKYAYFVKSETTEKEIQDYLISRFSINQRLIMVFAYGSAKLNTVKAVAEILRNKPGTYFYESKNNIEGDMEVHSSSFIWLE